MCEEGKHRSVAFVEEIARKLNVGEGWGVNVEHRDLGGRGRGCRGRGKDDEEGQGRDSGWKNKWVALA